MPNRMGDEEDHWQPWSFPLVFWRDERGQVTGFDVWLWGGWFDVERLEE